MAAKRSAAVLRSMNEVDSNSSPDDIATSNTAVKRCAMANVNKVQINHRRISPNGYAIHVACALVWCLYIKIQTELQINNSQNEMTFIN